jgi:hypothetical protein
VSDAVIARRIEAALFALPLATYAYFYQASDHSAAARIDLVRAILERRTLWIDGYAGYNTADIIELGGHIFSVKAPGTSFTALLPWSLATRAFAALFERNEPLYWALVTWLTVVLTTGLVVAILCVVMFRFALFLGATEPRAVAMALILGFATIIFPYATELTGEPIAAACMLFAFYLLAASPTGASTARALGAGLLAGWAVLNQFPVLPIAIALAVYAAVRLTRWRDLGSFVVGAAATAALLFAYNWAAFGDPFFVSYRAYALSPGIRFPEQAAGFVGLTYPRARILWNILVAPRRGLFFANPVLLLALPGSVYWWRHARHRAEFLVAATAVATMVLFNASYGESIVSWGGGTATGPRQIVVAVPFLVLALAFLPRGANWLLAILGVASAFLMLVATATDPHFPYEYANPLLDFAMRNYFRGALALGRDAFFGGGPIVGGSVAFNLGKLAGLPGSLQLLPLAALWIAGAAILAFALDPARRRLAAAASTLTVVAMITPTALGGLAQTLDLRARHGLVGRYYASESCGATHPLVVRLDRSIDFPDVASLGALKFPSCVVWSGRIIAPRTGDYWFGIEVDDAAWLTIDDRRVIADPGGVNLPRADGRVWLTAGIHRIELGLRNIAGDAAIRFYWSPPLDDLAPVPAGALLPPARAP